MAYGLKASSCHPLKTFIHVQEVHINHQTEKAASSHEKKFYLCIFTSLSLIQEVHINHTESPKINKNK